MPHLRFVPAFFCVALAHAALIAVFLSTAREPAPRRIHAGAIVAELLRSESSAAHIAVQSAPKRPAPTHSAHTDSPSTAANALLPRMLQTHAHTASPSPSPKQPSFTTAATTPRDQPTPPTVPMSSGAQSLAVQHPVAAESAATASPPSPATREMLSVAAPKSLAHADCLIPKPVYPALSKRRGETGTASVRFIIGTTGAIDKISIAESSGFSRLDDAAVEALRESTCRPYVENGSPIRASVVQAFKFDLADD